MHRRPPGPTCPRRSRRSSARPAPRRQSSSLDPHAWRLSERWTSGPPPQQKQIIDQLVSLLLLHSPVMPVKSQRRSRGRPRASEREAAQTRRALIDAAAKLIAERGYRGTTVNDVAQRSGLSKGTFYWHFKTKEELLHAVLEERIDRPVMDLIARLKTASADEDMAPEASALLLALVTPGRETILLIHEYLALAMRDRGIRRRYLKRQAALRNALASGLDARARQLGAPS